jgi:cell migration-inducing and hyaluronan-binding protein
VCTGDIGRIQFNVRRPGPTRGAGLALKDVALRSAPPAPARTAAPPQEPITLSRNGKDFKVTANQSTVRAGTEIRVNTERPEVAISLTEMGKGSWVVFELPGFANAASGKQQDSIDALRNATETSYFKAPDAVWVKLVIPTAPQGVGRDQFGPLDAQTSIVVSR